MTTFKRLLVPVDFSDASVAALATAQALCRALEAEIRVVNVHQLQVPYVGDGGFYVPEVDEEEVMEERKQELESFIKQHGDPQISISSEVRLGDPETEINEIAGEFKADMIIMGTHGRSGLSHLLMGSVTESVLRHADVPLLAVRQK